MITRGLVEDRLSVIIFRSTWWLQHPKINLRIWDDLRKVNIAGNKTGFSFFGHLSPICAREGLKAECQAPKKKENCLDLFRTRHGESEGRLTRSTHDTKVQAVQAVQASSRGQQSLAETPRPLSWSSLLSVGSKRMVFTFSRNPIAKNRPKRWFFVGNLR